MCIRDRYYGSQRAWSAYNSLHDAYEEAGWSEEQISNVLQIQTPNDEWFAQRGVTSNYHGGGNVVFWEDDVLNLSLIHIFGESLLFSENLKEIYRNPKELKPLTYHSITNGDFCFFSQWITIELQRRER